MRYALLAAATAATLGTGPAFAAPPSAPPSLRVDVYSGTAAELFWSRSTDPDGLVRGYEIRRDGELVDTRDGLSYFTDGLSDGRAFAFTVTAVDFDGERSAAASVSVVGGDRGGETDSGGGRPPPPANARSEVYSSSAAEVFWDRSDRSGLSYEVSVDGDPVATTDGTSAFLSGLDGARGRSVDVVAIDANGQRSGAATVTLGSGGSSSPDPDPSPGAPPVPADARIEVYSDTAAELFWTRPDGVATTRVLRDGQEVASSDATSHFDPAREPGRAYAYALVSRTADGRESAPVTIGEGAGHPSRRPPALGSGASRTTSPPVGRATAGHST